MIKYIVPLLSVSSEAQIRFGITSYSKFKSISCLRQVKDRNHKSNFSSDAKPLSIFSQILFIFIDAALLSGFISSVWYEMHVHSHTSIFHFCTTQFKSNIMSFEISLSYTSHGKSIQRRRMNLNSCKNVKFLLCIYWYKYLHTFISSESKYLFESEESYEL